MSDILKFYGGVVIKCCNSPSDIYNMFNSVIIHIRSYNNKCILLLIDGALNIGLITKVLRFDLDFPGSDTLLLNVLFVCCIHN